MKNLSCCMILKNEGSTIRRALESVRNFTDEYIIGIDSECNDNTLEETLKFFKENEFECTKESELVEFETSAYVKDNIYKYQKGKVTAEVYIYKWEDNFSEARNIGMDKATGDYLLILDGHEYFPDKWFNVAENRQVEVQKTMLEFKLTHLVNDEWDEVFFCLYQQPFNGDIPNNFFMQPRIYRNGIGKDGVNKMRFGRAAHNTIKNTDREKSVHYPEIIMIHDAPADNREERKEQRIRINTKNIKEELEKNPDDTRSLFYYANTRMEAKDWDDAIDHFKRYLDLCEVDHSEKYQVLLHKALCHQAKEEYDEALDDLHLAHKADPMRRDALCVIADIYLIKEMYEMCIHYYQLALQIKPKASRMFSNGMVYTYQPHMNLAKAYEMLGDKTTAIAHLKAAYNYLPCEEFESRIKKIANNNKKVLLIDSIGSFTEGFESYLVKKGYEVIKRKHFDDTLAMWADNIWCEWADNNLVLMRSFINKAIIRIHGYEAYTNRNIIHAIDWKQAKGVVYVAKHIQEKLKEVIKESSIIENGVNLDKFDITEWNRDVKTVGYAGYMNVKKNPMRLAKIIKENPGMDFHLRLDWQDPFLRDAFEYEVKGCQNIIYHSRYDNLSEFWNQVANVISFSDIESFSYNIAEAMACGCKPYIYNWMGAKDIWPEEFISDDIKFTANDNITKEMMESYRAYIIDKYDCQDKYEAMEKELIK